MQEFKLIVAGGRDFNNYGLMNDKIYELAETIYKDKLVSIVSGMANGADKMAYDFAVGNGIQVYKFPADWNQYGNSAGYIRNVEMAKFADGLLAFWDGKSKGTGHMIDIMTRQLKKESIVIYY